MMITPLRRLMQPLLILALSAALAPTAMAANQFKAFFPIENLPFYTSDDQAVVKPIFWTEDSMPVRFTLMETSNLQALLPVLNVDEISADDVELALERAIASWNDNDLSSFKLDPNVYQLLSGGVDSPLPIDADFDNHNIISFLSQTISPDTDVYIGVSFFFFERDFKVDTDEKLRLDLIENTEDLELDLDADGRIDITIPDRQYYQGEIIEADIVANSSFYFRDWPEHIEDVPDNQLWEVPGSSDVEAIAARAFGFVQGLTSSLIYHATLNNAINSGITLEPDLLPDGTDLNAYLENPFERRTLDYDDKLASALLYPGNLTGKGEISGSIYDGRLVQAVNQLPDGVEPLFFDDEALVMGAPVFLAIKHPEPNRLVVPDADEAYSVTQVDDTITSVRLKLIAQVYSGQNILLETLTGGVFSMEPADLTPPDTIVEDSGLLLPDVTVLDGTFDSRYRFVGLDPGDYTLYIDKDRFSGEGFTTLIGLTEPSDFNPIMNYFGDRETFNPEFYGGAPTGAPFPDAEFDNSQAADFIHLAAGQVFDTADIITNVGEAEEGDSGTPSGDHAPAIEFTNDLEAVPFTDYVGVGGDMGDLNNDGWMDFVVAVFSGGSDAGGARINRIYINVPKDPNDPSQGRRFQDVTFGFDGVPGTADDVFPANRDISRDAKLGDFNNDGRLDMVVSNAAAPNRLFLNYPEANNPWGFRMREVSDQVLPGVLDQSWADFPDDSGRIAVGDIDSDGDLDMIVSLVTAEYDLAGTCAVIEQNPRIPLNDTTATGGDHSYDPLTDPVSGYSEGGGVRQLPGGYRADPLRFAERILINVPDNTPGGVGFKFIDDTLGRDHVFGDSSLLGKGVKPYGLDGLYRYTFSENTDRVPPIYPTTITWTADLQPTAEFASPMGENAFEPHIGPMWGDAGLDFFSVRYLTGTNNGLQNAYFQNLDIKGITERDQTDPVYGDSDTIPDGYFACLNYNTDWAFDRPTDAGFYCLRFADGATTARMDPMPLFIGIPDGGPKDSAAPIDTDLFSPVGRSGFAGVLGDFEYRGAPKPFILTDNTNGSYYTFRPVEVSLEEGARRGQLPSNLLTGFSNLHVPQVNERIAVGTADPSTVIVGELDYGTLKDGPGGADAPVGGESHGGVAADFDHDGDMDIFVAKNVAIGFGPNGGTIVGEPPVPNTYLENLDGFADFYNVSAAVGMENSFVSLGYGYMPLAGDIDNDGDIDTVVISAFGPHRIYLNKMYTPFTPPDNGINFDATQFFDATASYLPPVYGGTLAPPFTFTSTYSNATTGVAIADFNHDGRPDVTFADGGAFNLETERPQIYFNNGSGRQEARFAFNEACKTFTPIGAPNPAPRILTPLPFTDLQAGSGIGTDTPGIKFTADAQGALRSTDAVKKSDPTKNAEHDLPTIPLQGYVNDDLGSYYGVSVGDFSGDGSPDLFFTRNGKGPNAYINLDIDERVANSKPDPDNFGDGFFLNLDQLDDYIGDPGHVFLPELVDPCPSGEGNTVRKNLNRRVTAADFDGNGTLDVVIANGIQNGGAPNTLLLNFHEGILLLRPRFYDFTETNLPTVTGLCGLPEAIADDTYHLAAADFDHDGDIDMIFGNQSDFLLASDFPAFRYLENDGTGVFTDTALTKGNIPTFENTTPRYLLIGDFDGVGEWSEDLNHNGVLDNGEDTNNNDVIDVSEDKNGNGFLDPGEDLNGNGKLDFVDLPDESVAGDLNHDGIITHRTAGVWEPSWDVVITFETFKPAILINDPTNEHPGFFTDQSALRFGQPSVFSTIPNRGARAGDMDMDGDLDIVMTAEREFKNPLIYFVNDGHGIFADRTDEIPAPHSVVQGGPGNTFQRPNNPYDLELSDLDGDGDLDIVVGMAGVAASLVTIGGENLVYINRVIGGNFQSGDALKGISTFEAAEKLRGPVIYSADPPKTFPGVGLDVTLTGTGLTPLTTLDFGPGIQVGGFNYLSPTQVRVHITVDDAATAGPRRIEVTDTQQSLSSRTSEGVFRVLGVEDNAVDGEVWQKHD